MKLIIFFIFSFFFFFRFEHRRNRFYFFCIFSRNSIFILKESIEQTKPEFTKVKKKNKKNNNITKTNPMENRQRCMHS